MNNIIKSVIYFFVFIYFVFFSCKHTSADLLIPPIIWHVPFDEDKTINADIYFPDGFKRYSRGWHITPNPKTRLGAISLSVPGPCDYSYKLFDKNNKLIIKESGRSEQYGRQDIQCKKEFKFPNVGKDESLDYVIKFSITLHRYQKDNMKENQKENQIDAKAQNTTKTTNKYIMRSIGRRGYGNPRIKYSLIDYKGEKITGTKHISIPNSIFFSREERMKLYHK